MKRLFLTLLIILCLCSQAWATNHYVTQSGAGDHDGTEGDSWSVAEFNALTGTGYAGDTFYFSGTFTDRPRILNIDGTSGDQVILDGYEGGDCDPINAVCSSSALLEAGMSIGENAEGPDYITIQDFRITNQTGSGSSSNNYGMGLRIYADVSEGDDEAHVDYLIFQRNYIFETNGCLFYYYSGRYSTFENNKFFVYGQNDTDSTQGVNLIQVDDFVLKGNEIGHDETNYPSGCTDAELIELHGCHNVLIEYNDIYGAPNQAGIRPKEAFGGNSYFVIRFNKVHDNDGLGDGVSNGKGIYCRTGGLPDSIHHIYIYGNYIYSNQNYGLFFGNGVTDVYAWSNIITDNGRNGVEIWQSDTVGPWYFYNNTIAGNNIGAEETGDSGGGFVFNAGSNINVKNNILLNNRPAGLESKYNQLYSSQTISSLEHNNYYHSLSTPTWYYDGAYRSLATMQGTYNFEDDAPAGFIGDPGLTSPDNDNYTIAASNSAVVDAGIDMGTGAIATVTIQDVDYPMPWDAALGDGTDWSGTIPVIELLHRDDLGWDQGAYAYQSSRKGVIIIN